MRRGDEKRLTNEHRATANERDRRYRERKQERLRLPPPERLLSGTILQAAPEAAS